MMFMNGLFAAYFVRWVLRRLAVEHLLDRQMQAKLTGFTTDYVVVASFMAVQAAVVVAWLVPILVTVVVVTAVTVVLCFVIGQRYGSDHDFERTMGMYGTLTGTTPTGLALVRILDPRMRTTTMAEMGLMNLPETAVHPGDSADLRSVRRGARVARRRRGDGSAHRRLFRAHGGHPQLRQAHVDPRRCRRPARRARIGADLALTP